ncbi:surfactant protein C [Paroedura picta]|uniref:surfactant protein C n=1 Tax=Paroedura picta TaxID=143630 RepID=UPI0040570ADA
METDSKEVLLMEAPPDYTASPRLPGLPCKKLLIVVVVVVVIVLVILGSLLMGLHITEKHTETVLQMTIQGLEGEGSLQHLSMTRKEKLATFHVRVDGNTSATVVYDYSNLLIAYRSWPGQSCCITKMNKENIQNLDAIIKVFQQVQRKTLTHPHQQIEEEEEGFPVFLTDRSLLSTTVNILCSSVPIYWA